MQRESRFNLQKNRSLEKRYMAAYYEYFLRSHGVLLSWADQAHWACNLHYFSIFNSWIIKDQPVKVNSTVAVWFRPPTCDAIWNQLRNACFLKSHKRSDRLPVRGCLTHTVLRPLRSGRGPGHFSFRQYKYIDNFPGTPDCNHRYLFPEQEFLQQGEDTYSLEIILLLKNYELI